MITNYLKLTNDSTRPTEYILNSFDCSHLIMKLLDPTFEAVYSRSSRIKTSLAKIENVVTRLNKY